MLTQQNFTYEDAEQNKLASTPLVNKINSDLIKFRSLVSHLRLKDRKPSDHSFQNQSDISNIEPKSERSSFELDLPMDKTVKKFTIGSAIPISHQDLGDRALKYKPRSNVNGRDDIRIRNVDQIHKQILESLEKARKKTHDNQEEYFEHEKQKFLHNDENPKLRTPNMRRGSLENNRFRHYSKTEKLKNYGESRQKKQFNETNPEEFVNQIEPKNLLQFLEKQKQYVESESDPSEIYSFFTKLCSKFGYKDYFEQPLIKRYKNCVYFGEKVPKYGNYLGFVWYYRRAIYYGEFMGGKKNGYGIQIDMDNRCNFIWRGTFLNGKKTGYFQLTTPELSYHGTVKNSFFDGEGLLKTKKSTYKGNFQAGLKQGYGIENFHEKGLTYKGQYLQNKFQGKGQVESGNYFYSGEFRSGKTHGNGFQRASDFQYVGEFRNGKKNGKGILKMKNGAIYEGIFENGKITNNYRQERQAKKDSSKYTINIPIQSRVKEEKTRMSNVRLEKYLSKELDALHEENEEGTIEHEQYKKFERSPIKLYEINDGNDADEDDPLHLRIQQNLY